MPGDTMPGDGKRFAQLIQQKYVLPPRFTSPKLEGNELATGTPVWGLAQAVDVLQLHNDEQDERIRSLLVELAQVKMENQRLTRSLAALDQTRKEMQGLQAKLDRLGNSLTERKLRALLMEPNFLVEAFITEEFMDIHDALNLELVESIDPAVFLWDPIAPETSTTP